MPAIMLAALSHTTVCTLDFGMFHDSNSFVIISDIAAAVQSDTLEGHALPVHKWQDECSELSN